MKRCVITGAAGFIGSRLAGMLQSAGIDVTCLVRGRSRTQALEKLQLRVVRVEFDDAAALRSAVAGHDAVIHLAGLVRAMNAAELHAANAGGVRSVVEACAAQSTPPTLVVVSSLAAAGPAINGLPRHENQPPTPVSDYGRSKLAGEVEACRHAARVPVTIVRPSIVFGGGDRVTLAWFHSIARFGSHFVPGDVRQKFSVVHVDDLAEAIRVVAQRGERIDPAVVPGSPTGPGIYFVGHPQTVTWSEIGGLSADALGCKTPRMPVIPAPLLWGVGMFCEGVRKVVRRPVLIGLDKVREACAGSWTCSSQRLADLGFDFTTPLSERFVQTVADYRRLGLLR